MAKVKNNRQFTLQVPKNKADHEVESRFIAYYETAENKQQLMREFVYVGTILRGLSGVTQQIMDLERSGALSGLSQLEQRKAIANVIAGSVANLSSLDTVSASQPEVRPTVEEKEEPKPVEASGLTNYGA